MSTRKRKKLQKNDGEKEILSQIKAAKASAEFEPCTFNYIVPMSYTPDFIVRTPSGKEFILEVKGFHKGLQQWCQKIRHFVEQNPQIDFRILFHDASKKFNKGYKSTLGDWATKNNIKWANKTIPSEWLK